MKNDFYKMVVLRNYKVFKKNEKTHILENAIKDIDNFLLQTFHFETMITDEFLQKNQDIKNHDEIKRLNNKYRRLVEIEINSRITE